jgi:hypothetical protein
MIANFKIDIHRANIRRKGVYRAKGHFYSIAQSAELFSRPLHSASCVYAVIYNQDMPNLVGRRDPMTAFAGAACLVEPPVQKRIQIGDRKVQIKPDDIGSQHSTAGDADNQVYIAWQFDDVLVYAVVQFIKCYKIHITPPFLSSRAVTTYPCPKSVIPPFWLS